MVCILVTKLTCRLALVSGRATIWHLQVGLTAAAVFYWFWSRGRSSC